MPAAEIKAYIALHRGEEVLAVKAGYDAKGKVRLRKYVDGAWTAPKVGKPGEVKRPVFALTDPQKKALRQIGLGGDDE